ncbi:MAG: sulfur carrier protein ThiS [Elusimicrobia bacterium]|nr:sulfur carrier protein ThiS [Elusimicrobiota bacterium]MBI2915424.1 sulfur carrier protein ThiS [Elusimicrobiota bacterium]MBI3012897.1 sulfur carrier protein ThiS [Elusimicrobiota bacterium]MBI4217562.1 sulfur carrier protein ThiS [Elusimicrobiota bacterium]
MKILLNGKETTLPNSLTLKLLLEQLQIQSGLVACEHNLKIVRRQDYEHTTIEEGDQIEILQMIGGG